MEYYCKNCEDQICTLSTKEPLKMEPYVCPSNTTALCRWVKVDTPATEDDHAKKMLKNQETLDL